MTADLWATKQECLCQVSKDGIMSGAKFKRITRAHEIEFKCQRENCPFSVTISEVRDPEAMDFLEPLWVITTNGDHVHDPTEVFTAVPLPEHLRSVTAQQAALGLTGAALASAANDIPIDKYTALFGEVGLTGEVRPVSRADKRVNECIKTGFKRVILPAKNMKACEKYKDQIELVPVQYVGQMIKALNLRNSSSNIVPIV